MPQATAPERKSAAPRVARAWTAWYEPPGLVLPGDAVPETTLAFDAAGMSPVVELLIAALGQTVPDLVSYTVVDNVPQIPIGPTPVFVLN